MSQENSQSDEEENRYEKSYEVPGNVIVDFGFNFLNNSSGDFETGFWGSKSLSLTYMYAFEWEDSHFSINPGIGITFEKFDFREDFTLSIDRNEESEAVRLVEFDARFDNFDFSSIEKSKLAAHYIDIPLEFRYYKNKHNKDRGLRLSVGVLASIFLTGHTKIVYENDQERFKNRVRNDFNLNPFQLGIIGRVGIGGFNVFVKNRFTQLFESDQGPEQTEASYFTLGLSFIGF
ncbi:MAG: outer membrane beta-barrel protein [Bacteroidota bacterium]